MSFFAKISGSIDEDITTVSLVFVFNSEIHSCNFQWTSQLLSFKFTETY